MDIALWIITGLLALAFLGAGILKLLRPRTALIDGGMPWAAEFSSPAIKTVAALEAIGAIGLVLPRLTGVAPLLSPIAALGLAALMTDAVVVHARRDEPVLPPLVLGVLSIVAAVLGFIVLI
ncbi:MULTISPECIES: DoxX family protein [unclassified Curtobacterium]|uniref:DoxX family protein n=1 Tax=unclassified Curtobacterium TaxID=257496 RepID=UPI000DA800F8|nr:MULTISPECIES: DoxX family protein [unclassified Curtobacterium]PZE66175.1 DoxX family protein [Curtobacterium sp. MCLR17_059]PZF53969.1 DoxX family protein [Curtobacterium sp. MCLR17_057]